MKTFLRRAARHATLFGERLRLSSCYTGLHEDLNREKHIREAAGWLMRAQDFGTDRGVSYGAQFGKGFLASYPETTGYIIPTFLRLAEMYSDASFAHRAIEMGDWEIAVQLPTGAVQAGRYNPEDRHPQPAVFNTGQVLLGWSALYAHTHQRRFVDAAHSAAEWLLQMQEESGTWMRGDAAHADPATSIYNVKAAWGLYLYGRVARHEPALLGALRNAEFALKHQLPNGWYSNCCLNDATKPLLHTIAYTMQGLVGIGRLAGRQDLIAAAARTADSLIRLMDADGFIPGRIDASFRGAVDWCCLTGTAQTAIVWLELFQLTGDQKYWQAAVNANRYLMARHDISAADPSIRGGLAGSWPVWGEYGRFRVLNWATKFFVDALMLEKQAEGAKAPAAASPSK